MSATRTALFEFDNSFARELTGLYEPWQPAPSPEPRMVAFNRALAAELGLPVDELAGPLGLEVFAGNAVPTGATPIAQAYAGHQFGNYSPRLGDGRALLLGEIVDPAGRRRDIHLKGSGRTPFARGGDGKAVIGPMLREYALGEAMHALGVPTTRALAVVTTGALVLRESAQPGAILTRVAASHLRVGMFQYAAAIDHHADDGGPSLVRRLADHAIARHYPHLVDEYPEHDRRVLAFFEAVLQAQAELVARWMLVGFVHGVMNTDNTTISGETIDYGPCAFIDAYDPAAVFSSIDHGGRYAFGNQPNIMQWNLARFAETLLGQIAPRPEDAVGEVVEVIGTFRDRFLTAWRRGLVAKLGLNGGMADVPADDTTDAALIDDLLVLLRDQRIDYTSFFRSLSAAVEGDAADVRARFADPAAFDGWFARWQRRLDERQVDRIATAAAMDRVNPVYIPRNHLLDEALTAATAGDLGLFDTLVEVLRRPFEVQSGRERYADPAPPSFGRFVTYCGT